MWSLVIRDDWCTETTKEVKLPPSTLVGADMCECYQIGGPWIAEDPDCPTHGDEARSRATKAASLEDEVEVAYLKDELTRTREALERAVLERLHERS